MADDRFCVFQVGGGRYAIAARHLEEVIEMPQVLPLPLGPPLLRGVFWWRGQVVPLLEARLAAEHEVACRCALVARTAGQGTAGQGLVAFAAESVDEALQLADAAEAIRPDDFAAHLRAALEESFGEQSG